MKQTTITFHGGAGAVTGSNFLLDTGGAKFLVDCGLRQGGHEEEATNWEPFAYEPSSISRLIVTHAHLDHVGRIPKLVKDGFKGEIISTRATRAIAEPILMDSMELLGHEAVRGGRPTLYEEKDVAAALKLWTTVEYHEPRDIGDGVMLELLDAGHILGSAMVKLTREGRTLVCTGDLGGGNSPLLAPTEVVSGAQYLLLESVYGDKVRPEDKDRRELLENAIEEAIARGGALLIPAFSTERTQDLMFEIKTLMSEGRIPKCPVYIDSPLAHKITQVFIEELGKGDLFSFPQLHFVESYEESLKLQSAPNPKIIIAGSGMGTGGRVAGHEAYLLPDPKSTVLIVGYQAAGTIGRRLIEGEKKIKIRKDLVPVRATVGAIYGYSAHPDSEALLEFANKTASTIEHIFVVEGEPAAATFLAQRIRDYLGVKATTPEEGSSAVIQL